MAMIASSKGRPKRCSSKVRWNSPAIGSRALVGHHLEAGRERVAGADGARPSRSIASGSRSSNAFGCVRAASNLRYARGADAAHDQRRQPRAMAADRETISRADAERHAQPSQQQQRVDRPGHARPAGSGSRGRGAGRCAPRSIAATPAAARSGVRGGRPPRRARIDVRTDAELLTTWRAAGAPAIHRQDERTPMAPSTTAKKAATAGDQRRPRMATIAASSAAGSPPSRSRRGAAARSMPYALSRSVNCGRMPVALNWPSTLLVLADALPLEEEDVLHGDHVAFHADDLGDLDDLAACRRCRRPPGSTTLMARAICCRIAFSGRSRLAIETIVSSRLSASRGVLACSVVMRAVVAGVHRLQHVHRFGAADTRP